MPCLDYFNLPVNYLIQAFEYITCMYMTITCKSRLPVAGQDDQQIQHFRVVTAHNLMLYYDQMLSNLKRRCQGRGAAQAPGGAGAGAQQLLLAPAALRAQPSQGTMLIHLPYEFSSSSPAKFLYRHTLCLGKKPMIWHTALKVAENPILLAYVPGVPQQFR